MKSESCWALLSPCHLVPWLYLGLFLRPSPCRAVSATSSCSSAATSAVPRLCLCPAVALCHHGVPVLALVVIAPGFCNRAFLLVPKYERDSREPLSTSSGHWAGAAAGASTAEQGISSPAQPHCPALDTFTDSGELGALDRSDRRLSNPGWQGRG